MPDPAWIPALVMLADSAYDWGVYINVLYLMFTKDFIESLPAFKGQKVQLKRYPITDGKEATFWHLISEGGEEDNRRMEEPRCERIRWPRPMIEHVPCAEVHLWESKRGNETRSVLAFNDFSYIVVLAHRNGYVLPWTAYPIERNHRREKLRKEHQEYQQKITGAATG
jgi:hypothetical protein